LPLILCRPFP